MREQELGPDHFEVAASLNNLAVLLKIINSNEEAESLFARSISIKEANLGPSHPQVILDYSADRTYPKQGRKGKLSVTMPEQKALCCQSGMGKHSISDFGLVLSLFLKLQ